MGSLTPTRDFTYVDDTVDGFIKSIYSKKVVEVINIGSGFEISISDLVKKIAKLMGKKLRLFKRREKDQNQAKCKDY